MTEPVIHALEMVKIENNNTGRLARALHPLKLIFHRLLEKTTVIETRQRVSRRQRFKAALIGAQPEFVL